MERLQAAAAAAGSLSSPSTASPSKGSRITAPSQRPSTGATLAVLGGGVASPFRIGAQHSQQQQQQQEQAGLPHASMAGGARLAPGAADLQVTGGRPPTALHPTDAM